MEAYADLDLVGYLYNDCYGGFGFSDEFIKRINKRRAAEGLGAIKGYEMSYKKWRADPMFVSLVEEMTPKKAAGDFARICIHWVPREFVDYMVVEEYDGKETVVLPSLEMYGYLLRDFLVEWKADPTLGVAELERRYESMKVKLERYQEFQREKTEFLEACIQ